VTAPAETSRRSLYDGARSRRPRDKFSAADVSSNDCALDTPSQKEFAADGYVLSRAEWNGLENYCDTSAEKKIPTHAPSARRILKNLPPALVLTASHDPLRDEGERFAERLIAAGVKTTCTATKASPTASSASPTPSTKAKKPAPGRRRIKGGFAR